jgi:hypothetical protein
MGSSLPVTSLKLRPAESKAGKNKNIKIKNISLFGAQAVLDCSYRVFAASALRRRIAVRKITLLTLILFWLVPVSSPAQVARTNALVRDADTGAGLAGVKIWSPEGAAHSRADGRFQLPATAGPLVLRQPGYRPQRISGQDAQLVELQPVVPKALYLSYWAAASRERRNQLLQLLRTSGMNALVLDLKSARGDIAFRSESLLARQVGAQKQRTLKDLPQFLEQLRRRGIYTIGRIAVFKDDALARARRDLAVHTLDGYLWQDRDQLSWSDPYSQEVQDYNLALAEEAAQLGFDEIQFDYIRFPARSDLLYSVENWEGLRVAAVNHFLHRAQERLAPYPTMVAADIFGYTCWKQNDGKIGQRLVELAEHVDYLSPMLYPSGFSRGIPGYANPVQHPNAVIARSLQRAARKAGLKSVRFRPWLQAFRDYAFDRRPFRAQEVQAQINASDASGSHGWMLWNAASRYSLVGLQQRIGLGELKLADVSPKVEEMTILTRTQEPANPYPAL